MKEAVVSETQLSAKDLPVVAECIAYMRDRVAGKNREWAVVDFGCFFRERTGK